VLSSIVEELRVNAISLMITVLINGPYEVGDKLILSPLGMIRCIIMYSVTISKLIIVEESQYILSEPDRFGNFLLLALET